LSELFFFDFLKQVCLKIDSKKKASGESPARRERPKKLFFFPLMNMYAIRHSKILQYLIESQLIFDNIIFGTAGELKQ